MYIYFLKNRKYNELYLIYLICLTISFSFILSLCFIGFCICEEIETHNFDKGLEQDNLIIKNCHSKGVIYIKASNIFIFAFI